MALWAALNSLSSPGSAAYFHNYRDDPGYVQWRREAEREAANNPAVADKLKQLDTQLAQMEGQPRNPAAAPPVQPSPAPSGGSGYIWPVLFVGIVILVLLWLWRRRIAHPATAAAPPGLSGSATTRFRVGMTLPVDPSPFLLAAGLTKIQPPEGSGLVSVEAVGLLREGGVPRRAPFGDGPVDERDGNLQEQDETRRDCQAERDALAQARECAGIGCNTLDGIAKRDELRLPGHAFGALGAGQFIHGGIADLAFDQISHGFETFVNRSLSPRTSLESGGNSAS